MDQFTGLQHAEPRVVEQLRVELDHLTAWGAGLQPPQLVLLAERAAPARLRDDNLWIQEQKLLWIIARPTLKISRSDIDEARVRQHVVIAGAACSTVQPVAVHSDIQATATRRRREVARDGFQTQLEVKRELPRSVVRAALQVGRPEPG